jgi:hypothetical protein
MKISRKKKKVKSVLQRATNSLLTRQKHNYSNFANVEKQRTRLEFLQMEENWYIGAIEEYEREIDIYKRELIETREKIKTEIERINNSK